MTSFSPVFAVAVAAAADAFEDLSRVPRERRARLLESLAAALESDREALADVADAETSLGVPRLLGEIARTAFQLRAFADVARRGDWLDATIDTAIDAPPPRGRPGLRAMRVPIGPVAVYAASNFPFAFSTLGGDVASALAAGCPVVVKSHPGHPETSRRVAGIAARCVAAAGFPPGTFAALDGLDTEASAALVRASGIRAVGFTGSTGVGRRLLDAIGERPDPIPFFGELGSVNPVVLTAGAVAERGPALGAELAAGAALGMGQFCTQPGVILVPDGAHGDAFVEALAAGLGEAPVHPLLGPSIAEGFSRAVAEAARHRAVRTLLGDGTGRDPGHTLLATTATDAITSPALLEERFGPATLVVRFATEKEACDVLSAIGGSLTGSLHATPEELADSDGPAARVATALGRIAGRVLFAGVPPGVAVTEAMHHGGPWPASSRPDTTSVGARAIERWTRRVTWQSAPEAVLPVALRDANPEGIARTVNGERTREPVRAR